MCEFILITISTGKGGMITASRKIAASCACGDIVTSTVLARKTNRRGKVKVTCFGCIGIERLHNASMEWIRNNFGNSN